MIKDFRHKGLRRFFETGSTSGIRATHANRLRRQLSQLDQAANPDDMNAPGWDLHPLKGKYRGRWSVTVNGNWRLIFKFANGDAVLVDYLDYH